MLVRLRSVPTVWIGVAAIAVWVVSGAITFHFGATWHLDLRVYREAGHALFHGGSPFTVDFTANHLPFTYTPFALLVLSPLSFGPLGLVETGWWMVSAAALVACVALECRAALDLAPARAWAVAGLLGGVASLALEPVRSNFDYGQINLLLMVMIVADLTWVRPPRRGLLIGLAAAIKLTPLVYLFSFVVARQWRDLARGIGAFVIVTAISWVVLPTDSVRYWFHQVTDARRTGALGVVSNQSWNGMVHRAPFHGGHLGTAVWLALSAVTLVVGVACTRWVIERGRGAESVMVLALTELLISPVSWTHHWSWLVLVPVIAVSLWATRRAVAIALLVVLGLGVAAPYLWIRATPVSYLASNALVLSGAVALAIWAVAEWRHRQPGGTRPERTDASVTVPPVG
jgi:alpha-1,2-mannosyltransferase